MKVTIKSAEEIEKMRRAGEILAAVHQNLAREIKPGMSTLDIDRLGEEMIRGYGCIPSFKNYCGYPASICVSVNEEVVHGIPTDERIIKEGDIVSLDAGVIYEGYHSDAARTVAVGEVSEEAKLLIERTRQSFIEGIKKQWQEIIFMIFPQQLVTMQISLDMEWSRIFVDMELEAIFMKNRRFIITNFFRNRDMDLQNMEMRQ